MARVLLRPFTGRFFAVWACFALYLVICGITRLALLARAVGQSAVGFLEALPAVLPGTLFDAIAGVCFALPLALWLAVLPQRAAASRLHRAFLLVAVYAFAYISLLTAVSEWIFWDEYGARFNFIAVDYLIYTREVLGNILQSFPVGTLLTLIGVGALVITWLLARTTWKRTALSTSGRERAGVASSVALAAAAAMTFVSADSVPAFRSDATRELAGNGVYQLFAAFRASALDFPTFYATLPQPAARSIVHASFESSGDIAPDKPFSPLDRLVLDERPERLLNVVLISEESLGAEFVGAWGDKRGLTPNLDRLAGESLSFMQVYATGNRTVRGLEALSLSVPPTPGEAIVKRPGATQLFTLGSVFEDRGYDSMFLYGGYGYFDNMNGFFSANDYRVIDRRSIAKEDIHHETIWGVADEDLFDMTLKELDAAHSRGKPFFAHVMTTSNHRPYTYPEGRIDIASGSGREGAVKYSDYALGRFIEQARQHRWFENTVFVITADHGANARGTLEIPVEQYRIPLMIYSPSRIAPAKVDRLMSQIDIAPTLLGQLHLSYRTKFMGRDIFRTPAGEERAFVGNYQALGYLRDGRLVTLAPHREIRVRRLGESALGISDEQLRREAIAWYQTAFVAWRDRLFADDEANKRPARASLVAVDAKSAPASEPAEF